MIGIIVAIIIAITPNLYQDDDQSDCGNGLPCGPVPWNLPIFPPLQSPTPLGTATNFIGTPFTATPTFTPTPTFTETPTYTPSVTYTPTYTATPTFTETPTQAPTPTPYFTDVGLNEVAVTISAVDLTANAVINPQGTTIAQDDIITIAQDNASVVFGYIRGFSTNIFGPFEPFAILIISIFFLIAFMYVAVFIITSIVAMYGAFRRIVEFVRNMLPF